MNFNFIINTSENFDRAAKKLAKKYPSLIKDLLALKQVLITNPIEGTPLGQNCYKIRVNISSKNKGKSGGGRVITYVKIEKKKITLLDIYDKADKENITEKELSSLLRKIED
jgi:mRNA-degrading endonuclease RelE of RelBE toxin-antitoxin system